MEASGPRPTTSLLIAREGGPQASELTAPRRAAWARHLDRLPPASVAIARATRLILLALGVESDVVEGALYWGRMPGMDGYPVWEGPDPEDQSFIGRIVSAAHRAAQEAGDA